MPLNIQKNNVYDVIIASGTAAVVSAQIELNPYYKYTIICTSLGVGESIPLDIYDASTDAFIPMMVGGARVRMIKDYEILTFADIGGVIRINKPITAAQCGVTLIYR